MKILQIVAHPDISGKSFTGQLASHFRLGAEDTGHSVVTYNLYDTGFVPNVQYMKNLILEANSLCFAWPCMWEMPPAKMVDYLQTVFVKDFAFTLEGGRMKPILNLHVDCLISLGQDKILNTQNLSEAMAYCGLHPKFWTFKNVGPRLTAEIAEIYLTQAYNAGNQK